VSVNLANFQNFILGAAPLMRLGYARSGNAMACARGLSAFGRHVD
jgi:hypothetical protein